MQYSWSKVNTSFRIGFLCCILLLILSACGGIGNINNGQPMPTSVAPFVTATPTSTPIAPFVTATPTPTSIAPFVTATPTSTPIAPFVTATPTPTPTPVAPFVTATPPPVLLKVDTGSNTNNINPNSATCSSNGDETYTCKLTVGETPQGYYLNWTVLDNLSISINPPSGLLTPDQPMLQVSLNSIPCQDDTFTFSGSNGITILITWSCTA